jgi:hypothetical protein
MLVEVRKDHTVSYAVINRRGLVVMDTTDHCIAELCEQRLSQEERRTPEYRSIDLTDK